ncbi:PstS family phosphate ABC transporter substrate-binding protein [Alloalcanivorax marinus]|uniref:PstS family phosphate ABC transporter substrate-binding protein n=1 Tax=Alloalcanivorax marinus TaxID=1177169 RepID=UPI00195D8C57|nr:substrate-binding domain-containing protein [Alloalcanivorax marinus]MBM7333291.1 substrate-binding domain-containing protein [Alloalcanivorax marinus]
MKTIIKKAALAAAIISAPLAASATDLVGGGASLPALAYIGDGFTTTNPESRLSTDAGLFAGFDPTFTPYQQVGVTSGSIFAAFQSANPSDTASYCQTGSGTGKRVLVGVSGFSADGDCRDYSASPVGFSAPAGQSRPDFIGSDAPLTADNVDDFVNGPNTTGDGIFQMPALGALIALPVNLIGSSRPDLSNQQVCEIFSGTSQTWNDVDSSLPTQPIHVIVRQDTSGTVFAFTQYLAATCNGNFGLASNFFKTSESFTAAISPANPSSLYANYSEESGNAGVVAGVGANSWSIGFANLANVLDAGQDYADVNSTDPATVTSVNYGTGDLLADTVLGDVDPNTGLPQTQPVSDIPVSNPNTPDGCVNVIDPAAQLNQGYPIAAVTNLLGYTANNADPQALRALAREVVNGSGSLPTGYVRLGTANAMDQLAGTCIN